MNGNDLPLINATLNGTSAVLLTVGLILVRAGRVEAHRRCMMGAFAASCVFLVLYVVHKVFVAKGVHTPFRGPGVLKPWYLLMLFSHITLAVVIVPLALVTISRGLGGRIEQHRRIARWTWPLWMYVSVTGIAIYLVLYRIWP